MTQYNYEVGAVMTITNMPSSAHIHKLTRNPFSTLVFVQNNFEKRYSEIVNSLKIIKSIGKFVVKS